MSNTFFQGGRRPIAPS